MLRLAYGLRAQTRLSVPCVVRGVPQYSTAAPADLRKRMTDELKAAMKNKDKFRTTLIRSVLAEVYTADKTQQQPVPDTSIVSILRKAVTRRTDAAAAFEQAARPDLAENERKEVDVLQTFVPPLLSEADIDRTLAAIIADLRPAAGDKKAAGQLFKVFYAQVDRSAVDAKLVKTRAEALLAAAA